MSIERFCLLLQTVKTLPHSHKEHVAIRFFVARLSYQFNITFTEEFSKGCLQLKLKLQTFSKASMSWALCFSAFLLNIVCFGSKGKDKEGKTLSSQKGCLQAKCS